MIRTVILEDESLIRENTEALLAAHPEFVLVGSGGNMEDGRVLLRTTRPQLLLLDINLGDGLSFELLRSMPEDCAIIFITAYQEHALRAIKVGALDFLLKPLDDDEFAAALDKVRAQRHTGPAAEQLAMARKQLEEGHSDRIALREQQIVHIVEHRDIIYCEADRSYTRFHLADGRSIVVSGAMKDYTDVLPATTFFRPHISFLVNRLFVTRYDKSGLLHLKNGAEIPVAVRKREEVLELILGNKSGGQ